MEFLSEYGIRRQSGDYSYRDHGVISVVSGAGGEVERKKGTGSKLNDHFEE